ncbi:hypothetical protein CYLTODRAFT_426905 [Cylindrobasidium torrendii FP15055 ss-10]|uniref:F-box domain-containing protein n=1 Tax=Cylindrobasidium torrendii FP15055 ss-10 TaxID=1314674 RepID=A0A0D7AWS5_9AGAR|nr:hypothetical protein CYLTODRAFT_426905 [Cylindrobasidium torrendii FP15055 ss-10]
MSWEDLNKHIMLAYGQNDHTLTFVTRFPADCDARGELLESIVQSMASEVDLAAETRLAALPPPGEQTSAWAQLGVKDTAIFSDRLMQSCLNLEQDNPYPFTDVPYSCYNLRSTWETCSKTHRAAALLLHALTDTEDAFQHLPSFVYLAQHPRVPLHLVMAVHSRRMETAPDGTIQWRTELGRSLTGVLAGYIELTMILYIHLRICSVLEQGSVATETGAFRNFATLPGRHEDFVVSDDYRRSFGPVAGNGAPANDWFPNQRDPIHAPFWNPDAQLEKDKSAWADYQRRCFDIIVMWWAIMKTTKAKSEDIDDIQPPSTNELGLPPLGGGGHPDLAIYISNAFSHCKYPFSERSTLRLHSRETRSSPQATETVYANVEKPVALEDDPYEAQLSQSMPRHNQPSLFIQLPEELLGSIISMLGFSGLLSMSKTCRAMHRLCIPYIFKDPASALEPMDLNASPGALQRRAKRQTTLHEALHASSILRSFVTKYPIGLAPFVNTQAVLGLPSSIPLMCSLARHLSRLSFLSLNVSSLLVLLQRGGPALPLQLCNLIRYLNGTYPCLRVLRLEFGQGFSVDADDLPEELLAMLSSPEGDIEPPIQGSSLTELKLSDTDSMYSHPSQLSRQHLPVVCRILPGSLRCLDLEISSDDVTPAEAFPVLPQVHTLVVLCNLSPPDLEQWLRRCFPAVKYLSVGPRRCDADMVGNVPQLVIPPLHLEFALPQLYRAAVRGYSVGSLPPQTRQIVVSPRDLLRTEEAEKEGDISAELVFLVSEHVYGVSVRRELSYSRDRRQESYSEQQIGRLLHALGVMYPNARAIDFDSVRDIGANWIESVTLSEDVDKLLFIVDKLKESLPTLEVFIIFVKPFAFRPTRSDFPIDDGIDQIEQETAERIFERSEGLKMVVLTGLSGFIPDSRAFKRRVWKRKAGSTIAEVGELWEIPEYARFAH